MLLSYYFHLSLYITVNTKSNPSKAKHIKSNVKHWLFQLHWCLGAYALKAHLNLIAVFLLIWFFIGRKMQSKSWAKRSPLRVLLIWRWFDTNSPKRKSNILTCPKGILILSLWNRWQSRQQWKYMKIEFHSKIWGVHYHPWLCKIITVLLSFQFWMLLIASFN